jgi:hypothetical protein
MNFWDDITAFRKWAKERLDDSSMGILDRALDLRFAAGTEVGNLMFCRREGHSAEEWAGEPLRDWRENPNNFTVSIPLLYSWVAGRLPKVDPTPLLGLRTVIEAWHNGADDLVLDNGRLHDLAAQADTILGAIIENVFYLAAGAGDGRQVEGETSAPAAAAPPSRNWEKGLRVTEAALRLISKMKPVKMSLEAAKSAFTVEANAWRPGCVGGIENNGETGPRRRLWPDSVDAYILTRRDAALEKEKPSRPAEEDEPEAEAHASPKKPARPSRGSGILDEEIMAEIRARKQAGRES